MMNETVMKLPAHKGELSLTHNQHKSYYQSVEQWESQALGIEDDWVSAEQRERAIAEDSVWVLQWYPSTPIGFHRLAAADLDVLLEACAARVV
jgi:hypothetical protein